MKLLGLLAGLVVVLAVAEQRSSEWWEHSTYPESGITDKSIKSNREYKFVYNGQLATGIPGASKQHSATRIQALVSLVIRSDKESLMKLQKVRFGKLDAEELREPRGLVDFERFEHIEIEPELKQRLHKTVKFQYEHGLIKDIEFDGEEQPWSANIKRAVLNMMQVNLNKERQIRRSRISYYETERKEEQYSSKEFSSEESGNQDLETSFEKEDNERTSFMCMEKSVEGDCETLYTFESDPFKRNVEEVKVTKSINFEKCEKRPETRYNERFQQICPTCEKRYNSEERTLRSSTISEMTLRCESPKSTKCLIERTTVESQYNFVLFGEEANVITSYAKQELKLVKTGPIESDVKSPSSPIRSDSGMLYTLDEEVEKELFWLEGKQQYLRTTPYSKIENKIHFTKEILKSLVRHVRSSVTTEAPRQFARFVDVMREMTKSELNECYEMISTNEPQEFTKEEHYKLKQLTVDALALCYTKDCMELLIEKIESRHISPEKASFALRKLMDAPFATKEIIDKLMSICESSSGLCEHSSMLKQAVYLTAGSMMRTLCVDSRDKLAINFYATKNTKFSCSEHAQNKFIEKMMRLIESSSSSEGERMVGLKALSNAALEMSMKPLEKIIYDEQDKYTTNTRIEAILALRQLADQIPSKVVKTLLPLYVSRAESPAVRVVCLYQIMQCVPDKVIIDQITRSLASERHPQVAAFTFTTLTTFANSTNPCEKEMSKDITLSLRHARHVPYSEWNKRSKFVRVVDVNSDSTKTSFSVDYGKLDSSKSAYPQRLFFGLNVNAARQWSPRFVSVSINQHGLGSIIKRIVNSYSHTFQSPWTNLLSGDFNMPSSKYNYREELKELFEKLSNSQESSESSEESSESESASNEYSSRRNPIANIALEFKNQQWGFWAVESEDMVPSELIQSITSLKSLNMFVNRVGRSFKDEMSSSFNVITGTFMHEQVQRIPSSIGLPIRVSIKVPTVMQASGVAKIETKNGMQKIKMIVEELKPSIVATAVAKMECWSPIVNTGVKVVASGSAYTPMSVALELDYTQSKPMVQFSISPFANRNNNSPRDVEIFKMETRPITYSLVWPKQLKVWEEPEETTVRRSEFSRVHKHDLDFGEKILGLKLNSRQYWHRVPKESNTPMSVLAGPNRYVVTMSPGYEMPEKYCLSMSGKWFEQMEKEELSVDFKKIYSGRSSEFLNSDSSEESDENENFEKYYKSYKGSSPYSSEFEIIAKTEGSPIEREARMTLNWKCDKEEKACKAKFLVKRSPLPHYDSEPWKFVTEMDTLYPVMPMTMRDISTNERIVSNIETRWGNQDNMDNKFDIKLVAEQSRRMGEQRERSLYSRLFENEQHRNNYRSLFSPVAQYEHVERYSLMDEIKFDIDYNMPSYSENTLNSWFNMLKNKYYYQTYVSLKHTTREGRVQGKLNIDPVNRRYVNVTIKTPTESVRIVDMPMSMKLDTLNMRRMSSPSSSFVNDMSRMLYGNNDERARCELRTDRVNTFDNVEMEIPTSTCYTVLAKDCSSSSNGRFAILVKKQSKSSEKKTLKIVTEHTKLIMKGKSEEGDMECEVNGEKKPCHTIDTVRAHGGHVLLRCQKYESIMKCELPEEEITIYFDGYSANVKVSPYYRSSVCGLCGQFDENKENELESLNERRLNSRREVFESYLMRQDDEVEVCEHDEELFSRMRQPSWKTYSVEDNRFDELPESVASPLRSSTWQVRPVEATSLLEQHHEVCVSKRPVNKCPRDTYGYEYEQTPTKVVYACVPKSEPKADELYYRLLRPTSSYGRDVIDTSELKASFTLTQRQPKSCRQY